MNASLVTIASQSVVERGEGVRFAIPALGSHATGFVVRFEGVAYAYVNRCAHVPIELDWEHGKFFNVTQDWLICATHGATYSPKNGYCVMGPCKGKQLKAIPLTEHSGVIQIDLEKL